MRLSVFVKLNISNMPLFTNKDRPKTNLCRCFLNLYLFCVFQDLKLQPEESFVLKIVQLEELLAVRHSVFVLGPAGTGKTQVIDSLYHHR